jgi:N-carbamoyl-L-amino-acid hydrolase
MDLKLRQGVERIAAEGGLDAKLTQIFYYPPLEFDESCCAAIRSAAERLGYSHRDITSGAGHDACHLARITPTAMVFVPCVDGISHNESEDCKPEWVRAGAEVLMHAVLEKAGIAGPGSA